MGEPLILQTTATTVELRQLTLPDAPAYYAAVDANREHLSQFGDRTAAKYLILRDVELSIIEPDNPQKLRFGIWDETTFVGSINFTPDVEGGEIGYWLDNRHTGHGYATVALRALTKFATSVYGTPYAKVHKDNWASRKVLERADYRMTSVADDGLLYYDYVADLRGKKIPLAKTYLFEREGFTGHIYVDKQDGFNALLIDVHGRHPKKRMLEGTTRTYFVVDGKGTFTLNGETTEVTRGDFFLIPPLGEYEYEGAMQLFEVNISPDNSFKDEKLE